VGVSLKYLGLVLLSERKGEVEPIANTVADLYAAHRPKQLATVVLNSPLGRLVPGKFSIAFANVYSLTQSTVSAS